MYSLKGKVVLITGASDGIGAQLAASLASRGASLSLTARTESKLRDVVARTAARDTIFTAGDITIDAVRRDTIQRTLAAFGRLDVLINNAGRGIYYRASDTPMDEARQLMELNFFAPMALAQLAAPHLRQSRGTLVNISSIAGQISLPWLPVYSASKFALASLSGSQRMELRQAGVNVMCVYPGYVRTKFQDHSLGPKPPQVVVQGKRFAVTAQQCAEAVVRGIEQRRRTVVTPRIGWAIVWLYRFFPQLVESKLERA